MKAFTNQQSSNMKNVFFIVVLLHTAWAVAFSQSRWYVNAAAASGGNGVSWADAYTDLQDALAVATAGDEVWVAQGTYYPTGSTDRTISFEIPAGVRLYGGFVGAEQQLNERNWSLHSTVLSGDIGMADDSTDNTYNVVYMFAPDANTVLDGFTIRDGSATFTGPSFSYSRMRCGGGLYIDGFDTDAYPDIVNCVFIHNTARTFGGGVMSYGGGDGSTAPRMINCLFEANTASTGGGMARIGGSWIERGADLENCRFVKNTASLRGGGYYYFDSERKDTLEISNCEFLYNAGGNFGGALYIVTGRNSANASGIILVNVNFLGNSAGENAALQISPDNFLSTMFIHLDSIYFNENQNIAGSNTNAIALLTCYNDEPLSEVRIKNMVADNHNIGIPTGFIFESNGTTDVLDSKINKIQANGNVFNLTGDKINIKNVLFQEISDCASIISSSSKNTKISNSVFNSNINYRYFCSEKSIANDSFSVTNSLFYNNVYTNREFLSVHHSRLAGFYNCNFINNAMDTISWGFPMLGEFTFEFKNSIVKNNTGLLDHFPIDSDHEIILSNSYFDTFDCANFNPLLIITCGPGLIIGDDPMFVDPDSGDFRLQPCSPLVNAGDNTFAPGPTDIAGIPRIQSGVVDIGAYETPAPALVGDPLSSPSCPGGASGVAVVNVTGICMPVTFVWQSGGQVGSGLTGLAPGQYTVTATDSRGQTLTLVFDIPEGPAPDLIPSSQPVVCGDTLGGSASATAVGGTPPLVWLWHNGATDSLLTGLPAGDYPVTVSDANGCKASATVSVDREGALGITVEVQQVSCAGEADGALTVLPADGRGPYLWMWANGHTGPTLGPIGEGSYQGTLTDALGCMSNWLFILQEPDSLSATAAVTHATGPATPDGFISMLQLSGGTPPWSVAWSNGQTGLLCGPVQPGDYTATLSDANGCLFVETYTVSFSIGTATPDGAARVVQLWPNPASRRVRIVSDPPPAAFRVFSLRGKAVLAGQGDEFDVSGLPAGVYWVQTVLGNQVRTGRLAVMR